MAPTRGARKLSQIVRVNRLLYDSINPLIRLLHFYKSQAVSTLARFGQMHCAQHDNENRKAKSMNQQQAVKVIVLGGGYAGTLAALRLAGKTKGQSVAITLVNGDDHFVERIRHHQVSAGARLKVRSFATLLANSGVDFHQGWCTAIDPTAKTVTVQPHTGSEILAFDYLIYALGSTVKQAAVAGVQVDEATAIYTLGDEAAVRQLQQQLPHLHRAGGQLLIIGGGLTGIEAATEIAERYPQLKVTLVTRGLLGSTAAPAGVRHLQKVFAQLGITVVERGTVERLQQNVAQLQDGRTIAFDAVLWAGSFVVPPLAMQSGLPVNPQGRLLVDESLRVQGHPAIYAAGDAAATQLRMACATAMPMGAYVADHLAAHLRQQPIPGPFQFAYFMQCISLGRHNGLIQFVHTDDSPKQRVLTGWTAARIKEFICRFTVWSLWLEKRWPGLYSWPQKSAADAAELTASPSQVSRTV